ncbi:hypothetical protein ZIOFF_065780 [Zingiber officinale]|uniref:PPPDE domain-containing protein n=1 Tax=Zingiber officinale TaxID=94328 RepID=A0A8J5KDE0_ZINOF|nr:hypothetical protein ZIOFF_065780 [Zingiber officinale]
MTKGGNSKWMATLVQTACFPILFIPLLLLPSKQPPSAIVHNSSLHQDCFHIPCFHSLTSYQRTLIDGGGDGSGKTHLYLNIYDISPVNKYLYYLGLGIFHSGLKVCLQWLSVRFNSIRYSMSTICLVIIARVDCLIILLLFLCEAHGMEYGFGAHDFSMSGVFEVEPKSCPGFIFGRSVWLGTTNMCRSEFRLFIDDFSEKYYGDTYHLFDKNCNHLQMR